MSLNSVHQKPRISVVGGGLAGSECALQLASLGYPVDLYEMRGETMTAAHKTGEFAELVCSNSFGSMNPGSAPHQLKWEAEKLGSLVLRSAKQAYVPAGQALGVDRDAFAQTVGELVRSHPLIQIKKQVVTDLQQVPRPTVIATGPLTHDALAESLRAHFGHEFCYFFDAIAPIIDTDSINMDIAYKADRYDKGTPDYINCPLEKPDYNRLIEEIKNAKKIEPKHFETTPFFEGCMPIEVMVDRGPQTLRFGPMKPVGLKSPKTGRDPWAVVQLRQDNKEGTAFNMVGFQTRMSYSEQVRVFRMIPGLENAEFLKLGSIHRNLYVNSPSQLNKDLSSKKDPWLFFAGQITGVEGYFESTSIGLLVAKFLDQKIQNQSLSAPPRESALGSLLEAITDEARAKHFQPTNINFGLFPQLASPSKDKAEKKAQQIGLAQKSFESWVKELRPWSHPLAMDDSRSISALAPQLQA
ncbi:MAG: methylenetetrahydrofolate--tRNA-(uracil(54)-C(5))-methyltransferase (FADH(2)-oxidizing) TrmFO [Proteobacteria bacterium]|jgi:methylenetetrahydrofolate--tRNA-(uracil-5-)-methyltransferase|nr:methylenetetrahydrofolate--tRNA-(uracil(54)-C(5))-methyltransferase (FADH(2)-oxidizing) TrmFO [Pseudomonadota bacterium]